MGGNPPGNQAGLAVSTQLGRRVGSSFLRKTVVVRFLSPGRGTPRSLLGLHKSLLRHHLLPNFKDTAQWQRTQWPEASRAGLR